MTLPPPTHPAPLLSSRTVLTSAAARAVAAAAEDEAMRNGSRMCIAIVDGGAQLIYFSRMDDSSIASIEVAIAEARSALLFERPTKEFQDQLAGGSLGLLALPGMVAFA